MPAYDLSDDYLNGWADAAALDRRNPPADERRARDYNAGYSAALADDDKPDIWRRQIEDAGALSRHEHDAAWE